MRIIGMRMIALSASLILLSACSTMNSEFSCKVTAGDSCMTIEQVDAMTRYADESEVFYPSHKKASKTIKTKPLKKRNNLSLVEGVSGQDSALWLAPWKDDKGVKHGAGRLYAVK